MAKARPVIDATFWFVLALLLALCFAAYRQGGSTLLVEGLSSGGSMLLRFSLLIAVSFLAAGLAERLVPTEWVRGALGEDAGFRGIAIATAAGMLTPAGPFVSMPVAAAMLKAGASHAAVVAFLASWSLLAVHRLVAWELPILGPGFAALRFGACLVLPLIAGMAVRAFTRG